MKYGYWKTSTDQKTYFLVTSETLSFKYSQA